MEKATDLALPLQGLRILVVDDEFLIAALVEETLRDAGAETVSAATLPMALAAARQESLSAALLDVRLGRDTTDAVADILLARKIPFVFYSGHGLPEDTRKKFPAARVLIKPIRSEVFVDVMSQLVGR